MKYINCPKCHAQIEEDSIYCDQCGIELFVCPSCGVHGKGKRCTQCGQPLVSKKNAGVVPTTNPVSSAPVIQKPIQNPQAPSDNNSVITTQLSVQTQTQSLEPSPVTASRTVIPQPFYGGGNTVTQDVSKTIRPNAVPKTPGHLVCQAPSLRLEFAEVLIGRREGDYIHVFGAYGMVSGRHARISRAPSGEWQVTDLGSTNGTRINGVPLQPNVPVPIHVGDTLSIANLDFQVTI